MAKYQYHKAGVDASKLPSTVFVFGSNLAGRHGAGAALFAREHCGARLGTGIGRTGNAYALPTKDHNLVTLPLFRIAEFVDDFKKYAKMNSHVDFFVTRVGCGLAGYIDKQVAPLFLGSPTNCIFPVEWETFLEE